MLSVHKNKKVPHSTLLENVYLHPDLAIAKAALAFVFLHIEVHKLKLKF